MSDLVVDLSNLREAIGDDKELEQELFEEFISSSQEIIESMAKHCEGLNDNEKWRTDAHALKGIALNLGAENLGMLGKKGQEMCEQSLEVKAALLDEIKAEHAKVLEFLDNVD